MTREDRLLMVAALRQLLKEHGAKVEDASELATRIALLFEVKDEQYSAERRGRLQAMHIQGWRGLLAGVLIIVGGVPAMAEGHTGLWVRPVLGYLALLAGAVMLIGQWLYHSGLLERAGLILLGLWDALFASMLFGTIVMYDGEWDLCWPWQLHALPADQPRLYPIVVYVALCAMLWGPHLRAMRRERRDRQTASRGASAARLAQRATDLEDL